MNSIKFEEFLDLLSDCYLPKKDSGRWSKLSYYRVPREILLPVETGSPECLERENAREAVVFLDVCSDRLRLVLLRGRCS